MVLPCVDANAQTLAVPKYIAYNTSYYNSSGGTLLMISTTLNASKQAACASFPSIINAGLASISTGQSTATYSGGFPDPVANHLCNATVTITSNPPDNPPWPPTVGNMAFLKVHYYCIGVDPLPSPLQLYEQLTNIRSEGDVCPVACPVLPLEPITDPVAIPFENGNPVREDMLTQAFRNKLQCLRTAIAGVAGASLTVTSAWRPQSYQNHLREIVVKIALLDTPANRAIPACTPIRNAIETERLNHGLGTEVGEISRHVQGRAIDATWTGITNQAFDLLLSGCNLTRPFRVRDPVHIH